MRTRTIAAVAMAVYVGAIILANYFIVHGLPFGLSTPTSFGTYTVPVGSAWWPLRVSTWPR
jgi:NADH:ubiquinone oxidoreductase subunit 6 (subunit J)